MHQFPRSNQTIVPDEGLPRGFDSFLSVRCQREVGGAGVSTVQGPFGFAVADDEAAGGHFLSFFLDRSGEKGLFEGEGLSN